jgi:hypothetical protein
MRKKALVLIPLAGVATAWVNRLRRSTEHKGTKV